MKGSFLYKISKILLSKYEYSLSDLVIVLPSRRSSVFLIKELSQLISKPVWLPEMYSIEDFFFTINNLKRATNLELFFKFYTIYRANVTNPHSIERCYKWANGLINDFNEIDKGYVNHIELFNYLSDVKRIENWYLDIQSNQNEINDYSIFFKSLGKIYKEFADCLLSDKISYSGLSQRLIVDNLDKVKEWMMDNKKKRIIFLGLDALSTSQEKIIDYLIKDNLCDIFWDADKYFVENIEQESGKFLRDYRKKWPSKFNMLSDDFIKNQKEIKIIGTSKNISQSKLLGSILNSNKYSKEQLKKVAIILPNEDLLLPVLESIPKKVEDINVTMGYKLIHHPIVSLFQNLFSLYSNKKNIDSNSNKNIFYLNSDIKQLIDNPYFQVLLNSFNKELYKDFLILLRYSNFNYISSELIARKLCLHKYPMLNKIFLIEFNNSIKLTNYLLDLVTSILELVEQNNNHKIIEYECLYEIEELLLLFRKFFDTSNEKISISLFRILFFQSLKNIKLNFSGEPLNGIQIMGLLETRAIDFDEVFILSANEGDLPPISNTSSFIPIDIKLKFNIRTDLDIAAIYSSNFFNLIKRPKKTYIIYNQDFSSSSGERSRYINQLLYEIKPLQNTSISISDNLSMQEFVLEKKSQHSIFKLKNNYIIETLKNLCVSGLSPSTINLYNYCKKQFYFEKIIGVSENKNFENTIDNAQLGSLIHRILQKLYEPYLHIFLTVQIMEKIKNSIDIEIQNALGYYSLINLDKGKNVLVIEAINRIVRSFINNELNLVSSGNKIMIEYLEYNTPLQSFSHSISNIENLKINLKGQIDRIDVFNNHYRIIDYKTGSVQGKDLKTSNLIDLTSKPKILQLLLYAWLFDKSMQTKSIPIFAGVINLRARNFTFQKCSVNKQFEINNSLLSSFEQELNKIFINMFNENENFEHFDRQDKCRFCD